jgi:hypothetical protein
LAEEIIMKRLFLLPTIVFGLSCSIHASHRPVYRGRTSVTSVAYDIERTTRALEHDARYYYHRDRQGRRLIKELDRLEKRARNFRRTVERRYWEDRRSRNDFDELVRQYYRAQERSRYAYVPRQILRDLNRVGHLIGRLQYVYGGAAYYGRPR